MDAQNLRGVLEPDYRGPRAVFTEVHVLKALMAIGLSGRVGRGRLGELAGLGQGEVRTLIKRLRESGFIAIEPNGCVLTKKGEEEYGKISSLLTWSSSVEAGGLNLGERCWAVVVAGGARKVRYGIEQRDAAIKEGAEGAFTALYRGSRFTVPGEGTDCEKDGPAEPWTSIRGASLRDGDAVVIAGSERDSDSENGALAAALTLF